MLLSPSLRARYFHSPVVIVCVAVVDVAAAVDVGVDGTVDVVAAVGNDVELVAFVDAAAAEGWRGAVGEAVVAAVATAKVSGPERGRERGVVHSRATELWLKCSSSARH